MGNNAVNPAGARPWYKPWMMAGATPQSDKALKQLIDDYGDSMAYQIAEIRACRGEADAASFPPVHAALERCFDQLPVAFL
jgi:hypothetical protein